MVEGKCFRRYIKFFVHTVMYYAWSAIIVGHVSFRSAAIYVL